MNARTNSPFARTGNRFLHAKPLQTGQTYSKVPASPSRSQYFLIIHRNFSTSNKLNFYLMHEWRISSEAVDSAGILPPLMVKSSQLHCLQPWWCITQQTLNSMDSPTPLPITGSDGTAVVLLFTIPIAVYRQWYRTVLQVWYRQVQRSNQTNGARPQSHSFQFSRVSAPLQLLRLLPWSADSGMSNAPLRPPT